jgi:hypothetical protein
MCSFEEIKVFKVSENCISLSKNWNKFNSVSKVYRKIISVIWWRAVQLWVSIRRTHKLPSVFHEENEHIVHMKILSLL